MPLVSRNVGASQLMTRPGGVYNKTECIAPTCQICQAQAVYSLYIRKFTQLLVIRTKLANWQNGGINVEIATKSACQIVCHPRFKTGKSPQNWQNLAHVYNTDSGPFQNWQKNWQNTCVTPVTQTSEALPTRRTKWYNGWYNNHLRES